LDKLIEAIKQLDVKQLEILSHAISKVSQLTSDDAVEFLLWITEIIESKRERDYKIETWMLNQPSNGNDELEIECGVCGCSREFDKLGDRICFCDSCWSGCMSLILTVHLERDGPGVLSVKCTDLSGLVRVSTSVNDSFDAASHLHQKLAKELHLKPKLVLPNGAVLSSHGRLEGSDTT
jgi:hypothetical protein